MTRIERSVPLSQPVIVIASEKRKEKAQRILRVERYWGRQCGYDVKLQYNAKAARYLIYRIG